VLLESDGGLTARMESFLVSLRVSAGNIHDRLRGTNCPRSAGCGVSQLTTATRRHDIIHTCHTLHTILPWVSTSWGLRREESQSHVLTLLRAVVRSFVRSFQSSFVPKFVRSKVRSKVCSFVRSKVRSFVRSFVRSKLSTKLSSFLEPTSTLSNHDADTPLRAMTNSLRPEQTYMTRSTQVRDRICWMGQELCGDFSLVLSQSGHFDPTILLLLQELYSILTLAFVNRRLSSQTVAVLSDSRSLDQWGG